MHFLNLQKKNIGKLFIFANLETLTKKEKVCFLKKKLHFLALKSHKKDDMEEKPSFK